VNGCGRCRGREMQNKSQPAIRSKSRAVDVFPVDSKRVLIVDEDLGRFTVDRLMSIISSVLEWK